MKYRELYPTHKSTDRRRMAKQIIFSDSISITEIKDSKLDNWIETTLQKSKQNDDGVVVSMCGLTKITSIHITIVIFMEAVIIQEFIIIKFLKTVDN